MRFKLPSQAAEEASADSQQAGQQQRTRTTSSQRLDIASTSYGTMTDGPNARITESQHRWRRTTAAVAACLDGCCVDDSASSEEEELLRGRPFIEHAQIRRRPVMLYRAGGRHT